MRRGVLLVTILVAALIFCFSLTTLSHETVTTTVLFDREIVSILNKHCVMCHVENGPSFPLETYEQTWLQSRKIRAATIARRMPPWGAIAGYGQFANDNSLTLRETQFLVSWVEGLGPRNSGTIFTNVIDSSAKPLPPVRAQAHLDHWQLGQPSVTRQLNADTIGPEQGKHVRNNVIDLGLTSERQLRALEYMPGDRRLVRAVFFTVQETGQWIGSWTPWHSSTELPAGTTIRLPAGSHIQAEIHYQSANDRVVERGTLGLFFADKPTPHTISNLVLEAKSAATNRFRAETRLPVDTHAVAFRAELESGVTSIEVSARRPDGGTDVLLFAKDVPRDWPTPYILKEPVLLRRGTIVSVTAYGGAVRLTMNRY